MGLIRKIDGYYFRGYIPKSLVVILNKKTYDKKLYTNNKKEAQKLIKKIKLEFDYYILGIMVKDNNKDTSLEQYKKKIDTFSKEAFKENENNLYDLLSEDKEKLLINGYFTDMIEAYKEALGNNNYTLLVDLDTNLEKALGKELELLDEGTKDKLKYYFVDRLLNNTEIIRERAMEGYYNFTNFLKREDDKIEQEFLNDFITIDTIEQLKTTLDTKEGTITYKILDKYQEFRDITAILRNWNDDTKGKHRITQKALEYYFKNIDLNSISTKKALDFRDTMEKLPLKWMVRKEFKDLKSFEDIIKENKKHNIKTIKQDTINRELNKIADFYKYAKNQGYTTKNPFEGIKFRIVKKSVDDKLRTSFEIDELEQLFNTPFYTRDLDTNIKKIPAKVLAPIIALYSGMRLNELASLYREDIQFELINNKKYYYFNINRNCDKVVKSDSSLRVIPIHKKIIELEFIKYIEQFKDGERIYPELRKYNLNEKEDEDEAEGRYGKDIGTWFAYLKRSKLKQFIKEPKLKVFHSFRHNFTDKLAENNVDVKDIEKLLGHYSDNRMTQRYTKHNYLKKLTTIVNKIEYNVPTLGIVMKKISKALV